MSDNTIDLDLKLLAGLPIKVGNIRVEPLTLKEIIEFGYTKYNEYLSILTSNVEDFIGKEKMKDIPKDLTIMELILFTKNEEVIQTFINALKFFLREDEVLFDEELGFIFGEVKSTLDECKIINLQNFNDFVNILKYQNCVKMPEEDRYNPKNEKAKKIIEKLKKAREVVDKSKKKESDDNIDFHSIVSAVSTKSNTLSKLNVWDLTIYQLYDEYKRIEMIVGYDTSILAMMNGADIKDLKHWSSKIED